MGRGTMYALDIVTAVILKALPLDAAPLSEGCLLCIYGPSPGLT